jgi:hypothetical protein
MSCQSRSFATPSAVRSIRSRVRSGKSRSIASLLAPLPTRTRGLGFFVLQRPKRSGDDNIGAVGAVPVECSVHRIHFGERPRLLALNYIRKRSNYYVDNDLRINGIAYA